MLDRERADGRLRGPLHGIPILVKDNYATTTHTSSHLRTGAGSVCLAAAALGTKTAGSITCPASYGNVVGIKLTVGLTSRFGIVPITARQDTAGPLVRCVADAVLVLEGMAGRDVERDNYTAAQPWDTPPRYTQALNMSALQGKRIGVMWHDQGIGFGMDCWCNKQQIRRLFDTVLDDLKTAGAELVDVFLEGHGGGEGPLDRHIPMRNEREYTHPDCKEGLARCFENLGCAPQRYLDYTWPDLGRAPGPVSSQ